MKYVSQRNRKVTRNPEQLWLLDWRQQAPLSPAAQRLARRFRLAPATAALVASLAGLGNQESARG